MGEDQLWWVLVKAADLDLTAPLEHAHSAEQCIVLFEFDPVDVYRRNLGQCEKGGRKAKVDFGRAVVVHAGQGDSYKPVGVEAERVSALYGFN